MKTLLIIAIAMALTVPSFAQRSGMSKCGDRDQMLGGLKRIYGEQVVFIGVLGGALDVIVTAKTRSKPRTWTLLTTRKDKNGKEMACIAASGSKARVMFEQPI